jgi:hypothetical protein
MLPLALVRSFHGIGNAIKGSYQESMISEPIYLFCKMKTAEETAHKDVTLRSLSGEIWRDLPLLEDRYQVSSHGRIKSLARECIYMNPTTGREQSYWIKEKIRKISANIKWNSIIAAPYFECRLSLSLAAGPRTFMVSRLVYQAFIGDIDFDNDRLEITHKDGNGLNNHFTNLQARSRSELLKNAYHLNRHISPFALKTKKQFLEISRKSATTRRKKVIQYSLEGKRIRIFDSIQEAQRQIGIANLLNTLKGRTLTSAGFIWRYYPGPARIATKHIKKRKENKNANQQKAVRQYNLAGKFLVTYTSIAEAAAQTGIAHSSISNCLAGRAKSTGGFKWKLKL